MKRVGVVESSIHKIKIMCKKESCLRYRKRLEAKNFHIFTYNSSSKFYNIHSRVLDLDNYKSFMTQILLYSQFYIGYLLFYDDCQG